MGAADFVLCRKDGAYVDGRRPEDVEPGTLLDDLARRDFTMNAIAKDEDGSYIDPFGGQSDMKLGVIVCVGDARKRFEEDYLRMLRAIRFALTKKMALDPNIEACLRDPEMVEKIADVSVERVREEMLKCFHYNTLAMLMLLENLPLVRDIVFGNSGLWLKPTLEK
jgi:tRNA nucleotidyltransferase (CCA-adding enzyme)